ncbi:MAG: integrase [Mesorhizobium sp.]|nr:MAG: integrase [Mesorhizobium sp.]
MRRAIDRMSVEDLTPSIIRQFLDHLERARKCSGVTRNQRLATIRSLARFIGMHSPVHIAWSGEVRAMPFKKTAKAVIGYLEKPEMDALLAQPDRRTPLGNRDYALLLFLYNSGARADEAAKLIVDNLQLGRQSSVRLHGKGNKFRSCPLWPATATLSRLVEGRGKRDPVFLNRVNLPLTRFGIHRLVTTMPNWRAKQCRLSKRSVLVPTRSGIQRQSTCCALASISTLSAPGLAMCLSTRRIFMLKSIWK